MQCYRVQIEPPAALDGLNALCRGVSSVSESYRTNRKFSGKEMRKACTAEIPTHGSGTH